MVKNRKEGNSVLLSPFAGFTFEKPQTIVDEDGNELALSDNKKVSNILFNRLNANDEERFSDASFRTKESQDTSQASKRSGKCYSEWLKIKEMERRLKRKLVRQAQNEIKEELLEVAKSEKDKFENRVKAMEEWLISKKLEEAKKKAHLKQIESRSGG